MELTKHFKIPVCVCINKYDINLELTEKIEMFCTENNVELIGKISYSKEFTEAMLRELTIIEYSDNDISGEIRNLWKKLSKKLLEK